MRCPAVTAISCLLIIPLLALSPASFTHAAEAPKKARKTASSDDRALAAVEKNQATGRRVALVIGNGAYRHTDSMPRLSNPPNDADDMAAALKRFGFQVVAKKNLTREEMDEAITDFGRRAADSDAALFYYAGHGLQVKGQNYLVPVDANIDSEAKVPYRAVNVNQLLEEMDGSRSKVNIVMLDACRNNPLSGKFRSGSGRGLAPPSAMPKGTVIVYATDPGNVAADGSGRNGQFTAGLLSAFTGSNLTLNGVLYAVNKQVKGATNNQQTPYVNGPPDVLNEFSFIQPSEMTDLRPSPVQPQPVAPPRKQLPGKPVVDEPSAPRPVVGGIEMVSVPGGCFRMGDTFGGGLDWEKPVHEVCVSDFAIGKYEVTQGQWQRIMGSNPSHFSRCGDDCPVENVSWNDTQDFIRRLNSQSGTNYRLPTEAEWEYAARSGGRSEKYSGGDNIDAVAWYSGNSGSKTHSVGQKQPNGLGIYDMSGNVWEWTNDRIGNYQSSRQQDPQGPSSGSDRASRGGCWAFDAEHARAAGRGSFLPGYSDFFLGFRLVSPVQ